MTGSSHKSLVWRGAIGGVLGCLLKAAAMEIYFRFINPPTSWGYLGGNPVIWFAICSIPIAAGLGALVAITIEVISSTRIQNLGIIRSATIGSLLIAVPGIVLAFSGINLPMDNISSWLIVATFYGDFGLCIGLVAGIASGSRKRGLNDEKEPSK